MPIDKKWEKLSPSDWTDFAESWLEELRKTEPIEETGEDSVGMSVVGMNFSATSKQQWMFILDAVLLAKSDNELGHIAAGPIEHLLGWHGKDYIEEVERQATKDSKFARTLTGVWRYKMTDDVWARIEALQKKVINPLK